MTAGNTARASRTRKRTRIQEANEEKILDAGLEIFSTYGFRGATIDQIAGLAGMTKPNLLYYFRRKEDIHEALIQQYLICAVVTTRWQLAGLPRFVAIWLGAMTFALMHTPNASLMLATFFGGLCWCALYLRERALLPLAFSHAASALVLIALLPPSWLYSAEVSARFFQ